MGVFKEGERGEGEPDDDEEHKESKATTFGVSYRRCTNETGNKVKKERRVVPGPTSCDLQAQRAQASTSTLLLFLHPFPSVIRREASSSSTPVRQSVRMSHLAGGGGG